MNKAKNSIPQKIPKPYFFQPSSRKISILDEDNSIYLFQSPKKESQKEYVSPIRKKVRPSISEKLSALGY
jgi:hypothetical protein